MDIKIPDMSCGHCSAAVTRAVQALDAKAKLEFDMPARRAKVDTTASPPQVLAALEAVGFPASLD